MPTLNRFPLLGLWAQEGARRIGYPREEAEALGHAYAVLYAIRKNRHERHGDKPQKKAATERARVEHLQFGGDEIEVTRDADGKLRGRVGGDRPQTPRSYRASIVNKFPPGYYDRLQKCFRELFRTYRPSRLNSRLLYNTYDEWKKACGVGRLVDLDRLIAWCQERAPARRPATPATRAR